MNQYSLPCTEPVLSDRYQTWIQAFIAKCEAAGTPFCTCYQTHKTAFMHARYHAADCPLYLRYRYELDWYERAMNSR